jgi:acyl-phosphate glycerol 3-phosphate acyltransferase
MMTSSALLLLTLLVAYLIGGIPFGYLIARARGVDLFKEGSGNIGATNVGRVLGKRYGFLVFVLDFAKGAGPVATARWLADQAGLPGSGEEVGVLAGLAAILGHLFPVYLRFLGGKGVATAAGVVTLLLPIGALFGLLAWVGIVAATRYVSAASLGAAVTLCVVRLVTTPTPFARDRLVLTLFCFAAAGLVIVRHRDNIGRLLKGNENRLKDGATMQTLIKTLHVLALGLWFGMAVFFSFVVGLNLFSTMESLATGKAGPSKWFVVNPKFDKVDDAINGPKEYASRLGGEAISPMFTWYYLLQGVCGFLALATSWGWQYSQPERKIHRWRVTVLLLAVATIVIGWPLEREVSRLRQVRREAMDAYFDSGGVNSEARNEAQAARSSFILWHSFSLVQNFATLALVTAAMAMAAQLPERKSSSAREEIKEQTLTV